MACAALARRAFVYAVSASRCLAGSDGEGKVEGDGRAQNGSPLAPNFLELKTAFAAALRELLEDNADKRSLPTVAALLSDLRRNLEHSDVGRPAG